MSLDEAEPVGGIHERGCRDHRNAVPIALDRDLAINCRHADSLADRVVFEFHRVSSGRQERCCGGALPDETQRFSPPAEPESTVPRSPPDGDEKSAAKRHPRLPRRHGRQSFAFDYHDKRKSMFDRTLHLPPPGEETFFLWGPRQTGKSTLLRRAYADAF